MTSLERQVDLGHSSPTLSVSAPPPPGTKPTEFLLYSPGPVSHPPCAPRLLEESLCLLLKMWVKISHMLHPGNSRCRCCGKKVV